MRPPSRRRVSARARVMVLRIAVLSLMLTVTGRLTYVQLLDSHKPQQSAGATHLGTVAVPAPRGEIVDSRGRVLVGNKTTHVLTVAAQTLAAQADGGAAVLGRVAALLHEAVGDLKQQITPCGIHVPDPCWTGEPYQPVPVATDIDDSIVLAVSEHAELYPGVAVTTQSVLDYPGGTEAAHLLGYTGAVGADDIKANKSLVDADTIGRSGLEEYYDAVLRGTDGTEQVDLNALGQAVGSAGTIAPVPGQTLVTSIDSDVQQLAEKSLATQLATSRAAGNPAPSGAVVVVDPHTGRVIAAASYPTYDPSEFVGGISTANYAKLMAPSAGDPLVGRAIDGALAPGSTFKLITSSTDVMNGAINLTDTYPCPGVLDVDGRPKTNYDSESFGGPITLRFALQVSCDTFFYAPAVAQYYADQTRISKGEKPLEQLQAMARAFGVGSSPGIDLPADEQATGSVADRETQLASWNANKATYCADAKKGYPDESNPTTRAYLTLLASQNCTDGWRFFAGNNADTAIGQGGDTMSPLQLAMAYSALVNGGTLYAPTLGWAVENSAGKVTQTITPKVIRKVPVKASVLDYIARSLHFDNSHSVSGAIAFDGSPIQTLISGKTGTAEVYGKKDTSWFASWGPVSPGQSPSKAKFVVVGMVEQAGLGSSAAAPMVRSVYNGLLGVNEKAVLPGSKPATSLPKTIATTPTNLTTVAPTSTPSSTASTTPSSTASTIPSSTAAATISPAVPTVPVHSSSPPAVTASVTASSSKRR